MEKITAILIIAALICLSSVPIANSGSTATILGSFQPQATVSMQSNTSYLNASTMEIGGNYKWNNPAGQLNVSNDGTVNCSITVQAFNSSNSTWRLVDNESCAGATNNFSITFDDDGVPTYEDLWVPVTVSANLGAIDKGWGVNSSRFNLTIWLSGNQDEASAWQWFYVNFTAAVVT